jgi:hypothetical protein
VTHVGINTKPIRQRREFLQHAQPVDACDVNAVLSLTLSQAQSGPGGDNPE